MRRDEVIQYIADTYGEDRVAQVITFNRYKAKNALKDAGRIFKMEFPEINYLTKKIPPMESDPAGEVVREIDALSERARSDERFRKAVEVADDVYGMISHTGNHPAAVVVTPDKVQNYVPTEKKDGVTISQFDGDQLEDLGLLKIDVLGLKTLRTIRLSRDIVEERTGEPFDASLLEARDDPEVYRKVFAEGKTLGVFQFHSPGMRSYLDEMEPETFTHIVAMVALYRPGPMELIPDFIARMHGDEPVVYLDESIHHEVKDEVADILDDTYGIMVFQEQIMQVAQRLAGFSLGQADILRRAVGKKKKKLLMEQKEKFVSGCVEEGHGEALGEKIFDLIEEFADYGFNKSHAAAYAAIAYQQAYFKAHHPTAFFAASLRTEDKEDDQVALISDAEAHGVEVLPPSVNESGPGFTAVEGKRQIRFGLGTMKHVGQEAGRIIEVREEGGPFASYEAFVLRAIPNKSALRSLIKAGALDEFEMSRRAMFEAMDPLLDYARKLRDFRRGDRKSRPEKPVITDQPEWPAKMRFEQERDVAGIYTSGHPIDRFPELVDALGGLSYRGARAGQGDGGLVEATFRVHCGSILDVEEAETRRGTPMWWVRYVTPEGLHEEPLFWNRRQKITGFPEAENGSLDKASSEAFPSEGPLSGASSLEMDVPVFVLSVADRRGTYAGMWSVHDLVPITKGCLPRAYQRLFVGLGG